MQIATQRNFEDRFQLVQSKAKDTVQCAHCALQDTKLWDSDDSMLPDFRRFWITFKRLSVQVREWFIAYQIDVWGRWSTRKMEGSSVGRDGRQQWGRRSRWLPGGQHLLLLQPPAAAESWKIAEVDFQHQESLGFPLRKDIPWCMHSILHKLMQDAECWVFTGGTYYVTPL